MLYNILSLRNIHNKHLLIKCSYSQNASVVFHRNLPIPKISPVKLQSCNHLHNFLKKGRIVEWDTLRRSLSTTARLLNQQNNQKNDDPNNKNFSPFYSFILGLFLTALLYVTAPPKNANVGYLVTWEQFRDEILAKGEVKEILEGIKQGHVKIVLHDGAIFKNIPAPSKFFYLRVHDSFEFEKKLRQAEDELGIPPEKRIVIIDYPQMSLNRNMNLFIVILIIAAYVGFMAFGKYLKNINPMSLNLKAKFTLVDPVAGGGTGVKFSDVAGLKEAKMEILDFVDYLKRPEVYRSLGAKVPKGALLLGPPGCGKTLLAKAVASEANVPFLSMNGSEFVEILGGLGASRVRDLFQEAKKRSPCIIYIDEIDAIGRKRSKDNFGHNEGEHTLNQLLVEMDGIVANEGVVLLASTNRAEVLDAALLRRGRFDRHILIDLPTFEERQQIFEHHLKGITLEHKPEMYSKRMAYLTPTFSGADIANVCNEAALHAARLKKKIVQAEDLEYAVERVVGGTEKRSSALSPEEKKMLAYYESGKALTGWLSQYGEALLKITIVSRTDQPGGWTQFSPSDKFLYSAEDLRGKMCMGLGGRAAITLLFNRITSAGEKDLKKVTKIAYAQIRRFGMNKNIGLMSFDTEGNQGAKKPYSKLLAKMYDEEAKRLITEMYKETEQILTENRDKLIKLAEELLKKETLNYNDVEKLIGPPSFKGKKLLEPLEFALSLDMAAGPEAESSEKPE